MPLKRKAGSLIAANAASAIAYTDRAGDAPNKRSKLSTSAVKVFPRVAYGIGDDAVGTQGRGGVQHHGEEAARFDHSRPEERTGIVDRRFYPAEMSNERCAMYNANEIPRPMEMLSATLVSTKDVREEIIKSEGGQAVIHWFKRDLRARDNTGLSKASALAKEKGVGVIGVWIMSPQDWEAHLVSPAKCDFELRSVALLQEELAELDIPLYVETVTPRKDVPKRLLELAQGWGVRNIFCNLEYEPDELRREERLVRMGAEQGIVFEPCHDDCVVPPGSLKTGAGRQFAVYSPWYRAWVAHLHAHPHLLNERPMPEKNPPGFREKFKTLFDREIPPAPDSKVLDAEQKERFSRLWPAGEAAALDRISLFLKQKIGRYTATRNFPAMQSTASVSVHHAAGTLAARTSIRLARDVNSTKKLDGGIEGVKGWIGEVAWRDFYRHVLVNWPYVWYAIFCWFPFLSS
jgi:deoxyribodipyrimidine photo-lyase